MTEAREAARALIDKIREYEDVAGGGAGTARLCDVLQPATLRAESALLAFAERRVREERAKWLKSFSEGFANAIRARETTA